MGQDNGQRANNQHEGSKLIRHQFIDSPSPARAPSRILQRNTSLDASSETAEIQRLRDDQKTDKTTKGKGQSTVTGAVVRKITHVSTEMMKARRS